MEECYMFINCCLLLLCNCWNKYCEHISINLNGENYNVFVMPYSQFASKSETAVLKENNRYKLSLRIKASVHKVSITSLNLIMTA